MFKWTVNEIMKNFLINPGTKLKQTLRNHNICVNKLFILQSILR
jgi:hypothetical protein